MDGFALVVPLVPRMPLAEQFPVLEYNTQLHSAFRSLVYQADPNVDWKKIRVMAQFQELHSNGEYENYRVDNTSHFASLAQTLLVHAYFAYINGERIWCDSL